MTNPIDKRDELRVKIEASERRNAQRTLADDAREAAEAASDFVRKHPLTVIGGAIGAGIAIGLMTRPGRRVARNAAIGVAGGVSTGVKKGAEGVRNVSVSSAKKRSGQIATLLTDAVIAYGIKMIDSALDTAQTGKDRAEDIGDAASAKAREIKREASYLAGSASDKSRAISRRASRKASRAVRDLKGRVAR